MALRDLKLKDAYSLGMGDDVVNDFYIPVLENSIEYRRIAGYFSSNTLALAAKGISGLIKNNGKMRLLTSPNLQKGDLDCISKFVTDPEGQVRDEFIHELDSLEYEELAVVDHVKALAWMLQHQLLEIKIAIPAFKNGELDPTSLFHSKVGYLRDSDGNEVTFSGSNNETWSGWAKNIEEFKVFYSWGTTKDVSCIDIDKEIFDIYWYNQSPTVKTIPLPEAVMNKFLKIAPKSIDEIDLTKHYPLNKKTSSVVLRQYQKDAISKWFANNKRGIFEMATGTGKTLTAIGCLSQLLKEENNLFVIILCPLVDLKTQWSNSIIKYGLPIKPVTIKTDEVGLLLADMNQGIRRQEIVISTYQAFIRQKFRKQLNSQLANRKFKSLIIADEAHKSGAETIKDSLLELSDCFDYRLALSATPERLFDEEGTKMVLDYFGGTVYEFPLQAAITGNNPEGKQFLVPYYYHPIFVSLTYEEEEKYREYTQRIVIAKQNDDNSQKAKDSIEKLMKDRADIIKRCDNKIPAVSRFIDENPNIDNLLVFTIDKQIDEIYQLFISKKIPVHMFTNEQNAKKYKDEPLSEREDIIQKFIAKNYKALISMKCLDEGVDIPSASNGLLVASTANPREYIQRLGRLLRLSGEKKEAHIYDVVVIHCSGFPDGGTIIRSELKRCEFLAENSKEPVTCFKIIDKYR